MLPADATNLVSMVRRNASVKQKVVPKTGGNAKGVPNTGRSAKGVKRGPRGPYKKENRKTPNRARMDIRKRS